MTSKEYNEQFSIEELLTEEWRDICYYEGLYQVSNLGRVKRLDGLVGMYYKRKNGTFYREQFKKGGMVAINSHHFSKYCTVMLCKNGKAVRYSIHKIVLETFVGPCPEGMECSHKDDVKSNNRISNLEWNTHIENCKTRKQNGHGSEGTKNGMSKLSEKQIEEIIKLNNSKKYTQKQIASKYNISHKYIWGLVKKYKQRVINEH